LFWQFTRRRQTTLFKKLLIIFDLADFSGHPKIPDFAHTHLVYHDVLQLNVSVDIT
jgi:hypothetical protein